MLNSKVLAVTGCFSSVTLISVYLFEYSSCFLNSCGAQQLSTLQYSQESLKSYARQLSIGETGVAVCCCLIGASAVLQLNLVGFLNVLLPEYSCLPHVTTPCQPCCIMPVFLHYTGIFWWWSPVDLKSFTYFVTSHKKYKLSYLINILFHQNSLFHDENVNNSG